MLSLIEKLAVQEKALRQATVLSPCVPGGMVRVRVEGLLYTFQPEPADFEGWGLWRLRDEKRVALLEEASPAKAAAYRRLFPMARLRLAYRLRGQTWLAYPASAGVPPAEPVAVHLVERGEAFAQVVACFDGTSCWFDSRDRRADPRLAAALREAFRQEIPPEALRVPHLTPEARTAYDLAFRRTAARRQRREAKQLETALSFAGATYRAHHDRGDEWLVEWTTADGETHRSLLRKRDLTVTSAGICLSGLDADFDLQSLVGVMQQRPEWMR